MMQLMVCNDRIVFQVALAGKEPYSRLASPDELSFYWNTLWGSYAEQLCIGIMVSAVQSAGGMDAHTSR